MTQQHTPGPWRANIGNSSGAHCILANNGRRKTVCVMANTHDDDWQPNARLIAAAPDMLAALRSLLDWGRDHTSPLDPNSPHDLLVTAHQAIAKAEGRS